MRFKLRLFLTAGVVVSFAALCAAQNSAFPSQPIYVLTNDDGLLHTYVSFFLAGMNQNGPTLTFAADTNTQGTGIAGGYFAAPRVNLLPDSSTQCVYASNAGTGNISGINIQTQQLAGPFAASPTDAGDANGIGLVVNANYLYAGYSASNTIATFSVLPGCQLSFLSDVTAAGLNGGSVAGMALHGTILVLAYADGSIESFDVSNGIPMSNNDAQNSTGYVIARSNFPEGVDITQDGHFAIFGDSSIPTTVEVSDVSSGKLTPTVWYTVGGGANAVGPGVNSGSVRLSPDESLIFMGNNDGGSVSAAFFDKRTGRVSGGCSSPKLGGFYNPWAFVGSIATRDNTGTGGVLYVAEYGFTGSYLGIVNINVGSDGRSCTLTESANSEVPDLLSDGLLSIAVFPPRPF